MRIKQTARKSTTHVRDPIRERIDNILRTKRVSAQTKYGMGPGGKSIRMDSPRPKSNRIPNVLRDIRRLQRTTDLQIPRASFLRLVKQLMLKAQETSADNPNQTVYKIQAAALLALQEAAEAYLVKVFEDANLLAQHTGRVTLMEKDMALALKLTYRRM